jgi:N4-(beta-N-acetylglucosaminyl)-L-asparaginase
MNDFSVSRRAIMLGAAAAPLAQKIAAQARPKIIAISSANRFNGGINCCAKAVATIKGGGDTLDAVIAGVNIVELDPRDTSVGYGGLPNEEGVVELDASCMHGPTRRAGAVGALQNIKTPSNVAKAVMERTDHIFLVGEGALKFAKEVGFKAEDLLTEESRTQWQVWKKSLKDGINPHWRKGMNPPPTQKKGALDLQQLKREFPNAGEDLLAEAIENAIHPPHGTINCIALNASGEMSAVTTTSGMAWKIPGRVGDSPIIGGGLWLDQDVGGAGSTGLGEENIRACGAHTVVENMRHGMSPKEAALDALKRVVRNFDSNMERLAQVDLQFYALRKDGEYAGATLWGPKPGARVSQFAVCTGDRESHQEDCVHLLDRK